MDWRLWPTVLFLCPCLFSFSRYQKIIAIFLKGWIINWHPHGLEIGSPHGNEVTDSEHKKKFDKVHSWWVGSVKSPHFLLPRKNVLLGQENYQNTLVSHFIVLSCSAFIRIKRFWKATSLTAGWDFPNVTIFFRSHYIENWTTSGHVRSHCNKSQHITPNRTLSPCIAQHWIDFLRSPYNASLNC